MTHAMQSLRLSQIQTLAETRGAHYNVFKNRPGMLGLFDACKELEDNAARQSPSPPSEEEAADSTDESNADDQRKLHHPDVYRTQESEASPGLPPRVIRPLDPSLANVRYLASKPDDAPPYTLVLDLDETLIHYRDNSPDTQTEDGEVSSCGEDAGGGTNNNTPKRHSKLEESPPKRMITEEDEDVVFFLRPGLSSFLSSLAKHYELVLYTAATREYADYFLRLIDHKNLFGDNVLTREHCIFENDYAIKDLRLLGRDLRKTIIIDNLKENFDKTTPDNGIHISNFEGCFDDTELPKYEKFLTQLALNEEDDIRDVIF